MKYRPYCQRQRCNPLDLLFNMRVPCIDLPQISLLVAVIHALVLRTYLSVSYRLSSNFQKHVRMQENAQLWDQFKKILWGSTSSSTSPPARRLWHSCPFCPTHFLVSSGAYATNRQTGRQICRQTVGVAVLGFWNYGAGLQGLTNSSPPFSLLLFSPPFLCPNLLSSILPSIVPPSLRLRNSPFNSAKGSGEP